ncbi:hypothetical protein WJX82_003938 [Trebouxia sp. C0006]
MQALAHSQPCTRCSHASLSAPNSEAALHPSCLPRHCGPFSQSTAFRPFQSQQPKSQWQRSHRLRAVSESTPALKKPEVASKPQIKEASAGNKPEPAEQEPSNQVTIQYQREQAKAMRKYFKSLAYSEEVVKSKVFGWTPKNEITNGRWVMFGFAVGLLTEYATGVDFIQQLKLMVSYLGIADIYD